MIESDRAQLDEKARRAKDLLHLRIGYDAGIQRKRSRENELLNASIVDVSEGFEQLERRDIVEDMQPDLSWQRLEASNAHLTTE